MLAGPGIWLASYSPSPAWRFQQLEDFRPHLFVKQLNLSRRRDRLSIGHHTEGAALPEI
jgi:hypothetical protein